MLNINMLQTLGSEVLNSVENILGDNTEQLLSDKFSLLLNQLQSGELTSQQLAEELAELRTLMLQEIPELAEIDNNPVLRQMFASNPELINQVNQRGQASQGEAKNPLLEHITEILNRHNI